MRETREETGFAVTTADLHLFAMIAEKAYEGQSHWLMFLFRCRKPIGALPPDIAEGKFGFFSRAAVSRARDPRNRPQRPLADLRPVPRPLRGAARELRPGPARAR